MKEIREIITLQIEIPVEYELIARDRLIEDLEQFFNSKYNKTSKISCSTTEGTYSWKLPNKNAKVLYRSNIEN